MSDDRSLLDVKRVEQTGQVTGEVMNRISVDCLRRIGLPVAALIRCDGVEPGVSQGTQLMTPGIRDLRKTVAEQHRKTAAGLHDVHLDAVGLNVAVSELRHRRLSLTRLFLRPSVRAP